jgi:hypothetical protein
VRPSAGAVDDDDDWSDGEDVMSMLNDTKAPKQQVANLTTQQKQQARHELAKQLGRNIKQDVDSHQQTGRWQHEHSSPTAEPLETPTSASILQLNRTGGLMSTRGVDSSGKRQPLMLSLLGQGAVSIKLAAKATRSDGSLLAEDEVEIAWARVHRDGIHEPICGAHKMVYQISADEVEKAIRVDIKEKTTQRIVHAVSQPIAIGAQLERIVRHYLNLGAAIFDLNLVVQESSQLEGRKLIVNTRSVKIKKNNSTQFKGVLGSSKHLILEPGSLRMYITLDVKKGSQQTVCLQAHTPEERNLVALVVRCFQAKPTDANLAISLKQLAAECLYDVAQNSAGSQNIPPGSNTANDDKANATDKAPPVGEEMHEKHKKGSLTSRLFKKKT